MCGRTTRKLIVCASGANLSSRPTSLISQQVSRPSVCLFGWASSLLLWPSRLGNCVLKRERELFHKLSATTSWQTSWTSAHKKSLTLFRTVCAALSHRLSSYVSWHTRTLVRCCFRCSCFQSKAKRNWTELNRTERISAPRRQLFSNSFICLRAVCLLVCLLVCANELQVPQVHNGINFAQVALEATSILGQFGAADANGTQLDKQKQSLSLSRQILCYCSDEIESAKRCEPTDKREIDRGKGKRVVGFVCLSDVWQ